MTKKKKKWKDLQFQLQHAKILKAITPVFKTTKTEQNGNEELSLNLLINETVGHTTTLKCEEGVNVEIIAKVNFPLEL